MTTLRKISLYCSGSEVLEVLKELPGELRHDVPLQRDDQSLHLYKKVFLDYIGQNAEFFIPYEFIFILPPPHLVHVEELRTALKETVPQGVIFFFDPSKPPGLPQSQIERLFNLLLDANGVDYASNDPLNVPLIFGVVLLNFESVDFDPRSANKFLEAFYPMLSRFNKRFPKSKFFEGVFTKAVFPAGEARKILLECVTGLYPPATLQHFQFLERENKRILEEILLGIAEKSASTIPLKALEPRLSASPVWIAEQTKQILQRPEFKQISIWGSSIIRNDLNVVKNELDAINDQISFFRANRHTAGFLLYLWDRAEALRPIIHNFRAAPKDQIYNLMNRLTQIQIDLKTLMDS
ncbi:MAG TPA: hypothetical protein VJ044_09345 [Candidatus Hodarchaeales archaeon]|nr:hypothetical protein [Candidatus Hodarchaeales archaeon]